MTNENNKPALRPWIEPKIESLEVRESQRAPNRGRDGGNYADCTVS